jgi:hypothetical protein
MRRSRLDHWRRRDLKPAMRLAALHRDVDDQDSGRNPETPTGPANWLLNKTGALLSNRQPSIARRRNSALFLRPVRDRFHLHHHIRMWKRADFDGRAGRSGSIEILSVHVVVCGEIFHVGQKNNYVHAV